MKEIIKLAEKLIEVRQIRPLLKIIYSALNKEGLRSVEIFNKTTNERFFYNGNDYSKTTTTCYPKTLSISYKNFEIIFHNYSISGEKQSLLESIVKTSLSRCLFTTKISKISHDAHKKINTLDNYPQIPHHSTAMKACLEQASIVSPFDTPVLIHGESGSGKELIANLIHKESSRKHKQFLKINCAAIPESLLESTLFGHEKGAFTGAEKTQLGLFERAHEGTLFLDEIADLSLNAQAKVLRVLENGDFERVGGIKTHSVNVRIIAATHKNLEALIDEKLFREDLLYRLNTFPLTVPPLRDRKEDLDDLSQSLLNELSLKLKVAVTNTSKSFHKDLLNYDWPGNVRELKNVLERSLIVSNGNNISLQLPQKLTEKKFSSWDNECKKIIINALQKSNWKVQGVNSASEKLQLNPQTLYSKIRKYKISLNQNVD
ncbi:MAG: sigma-54 dependent transcriptional regulator [Lentisphaerales bacterium]|nr:sigma-54 dependent transcriptional regulator [Lentisphaerales bacterium]